MPFTLLAHAGAGASWQALVAVLSWLTGLLFLLVVTKRVKVTEPGDLVLPLAGIVIVSSLGTTSSDTLSDQIGWSLPIGVIALAGLVLASLRPDTWGLKARQVQMTIAAAIIGAVALNAPLTNLLHPPPEYFDLESIPAVDDVSVTILEPVGGDTSEDRPVLSGPFDLVVEVAGGTVSGTEALPEDQRPLDPEELGLIRIYDGGTILDVDPVEDCSVDAPCTKLTFRLDLTPGLHQVTVEFRTAGDSGFRTTVFDLQVIEVE